MEISPPATPEHLDAGIGTDPTKDGANASYQRSIEMNVDSSEESGSEDYESDEEDEEDDDDDVTATEFNPGQCLFCNSMLTTFDTNLEHMRISHSFQIPYQSHLNVDLETFIWYLHMVVYAYHECLSCGSRRGSAEGAKQHMVAKGHCRVDVAGEIADFYNEEHPRSEGQANSLQIDGSSMRLSSGKVVGSRLESSSLRKTLPAESAPSRKREEMNAMLQAATEVSHGCDVQDSSSSSKAVQKKDKRANAMTLALTRLSASDQMSLAHLPSSEQRALLATRKKQLSKAQREERKARSRVERLGNRTLMKHFKPDVPGRLNG